MHRGMYVAMCVVQKQISFSFVFFFFPLLPPPPGVWAKTAGHKIFFGPVKIWSNEIGHKGPTKFSEPKSGSRRHGNLNVYPQGYQAQNIGSLGFSEMSMRMHKHQGPRQRELERLARGF